MNDCGLELCSHIDMNIYIYIHTLSSEKSRIYTRKREGIIMKDMFKELKNVDLEDKILFRTE